MTIVVPSAASSRSTWNQQKRLSQIKYSGWAEFLPNYLLNSRYCRKSVTNCFIYIFAIYKEGNLLFNDALNTFYLRLYGIRHMVKDLLDRREEICCRHIGYSFRLAARVLLYASSHRQDNTYHDICYNSCGAQAGTRNMLYIIIIYIYIYIYIYMCVCACVCVQHRKHIYTYII